MKIAIDGRCLAKPVRREPARYASTLIMRLAERRITLYLLYRASNPVPAAYLNCANVEALPLKGSASIWEQVSVPRILRQGEFDLLHIPTEEATPPLLSPCPVVMTIHRAECPGSLAQSHTALAQPVLPSLGRIRAKLRFGLVDHIIATSEFCRRHLISALVLPSGQVSIVPFAGDDDSSRLPADNIGIEEPLRHLDVRPPYVLNADDCESERDVELLLSVFRQVRRTRSDLQLVVMCPKMPSVHLLEYAEQIGLLVDEDVVFIFDAGPAIQHLYDRAELAISVTADRVCQPWIVQAMGRGLQVVCSASGCTAELVGCAGRAIERSDPQEMARVITVMLESGSRSQRAAAARQQAARFNWTKTVDGTIAVYEALINQRNGKAVTVNPSDGIVNSSSITGD